MIRFCARNWCSRGVAADVVNQSRGRGSVSVGIVRKNKETRGSVKRERGKWGEREASDCRVEGESGYGWENEQKCCFADCADREMRMGASEGVSTRGLPGGVWRQGSHEHPPSVSTVLLVFRRPTEATQATRGWSASRKHTPQQGLVVASRTVALTISLSW